MILSLLVCFLFFVTVVALVGVSEIGSQAIGMKGTATWTANATTWNAISAFGGFTIYMVVVIVVSLCLLIGVCFSISKSSLGKVEPDGV
jgi:hypothetical protein